MQFLKSIARVVIPLIFFAFGMGLVFMWCQWLWDWSEHPLDKSEVLARFLRRGFLGLGALVLSSASIFLAGLGLDLCDSMGFTRSGGRTTFGPTRDEMKARRGEMIVAEVAAKTRASTPIFPTQKKVRRSSFIDQNTESFL